MPTSLQIRITIEPTSTVVHRFRNFGEGVYRGLSDFCDVDLEKIDRATNSFHIKRIESRHLGHVMRFIQKELEEHNFQDCAKIEKN